MIYRNINLPMFSRIGKNFLDNLIDIIKEENFYFKNVSIICSNYGSSLINEYGIDKQFPKVSIFKIDNKFELSQLRSEIAKQKSDLILSIGGGKVNDLAKYLSMETFIPLISIPTVLSNDGIASPISILQVNGQYKSLGTTPPIGVIADIDIIKKSPEEFIKSGIGDLLSNLSAVLDWGLANLEQNERIDIYAKNISYNSAINILYNFKIGKYSSVKDENLIKDLFNGLIMSAVAMIVAKTSRPASGAEHNISHALDKLGLGKLHGIQVGFATLFTLFLHGVNDTLEDVILLYNQLKFPISFSELGTHEKSFIEALKIAPFIRDRYTILSKFSSDSIIAKFDEFKRRYIK